MGKNNRRQRQPQPSTASSVCSRNESGPQPQELLLDSSNWITVVEAHQLLCKLPHYVGYPSLAVKDLHVAVHDGRVPTMRRCYLLTMPGPERELPPKEHYDEHKFFARSDGSLEVVILGARSAGWVNFASVKGYAYFVWKPALAEEWPDMFASTQLEKPTPGAKVQSSSQLTEDQIQALMGEVSELPDLQKKIRRYAVLKYGAQWRDHDPAEVQKNARDDPLYAKEVGAVAHHITTFRRALGRKK